MEIRHTRPEDLPAMLAIYAAARVRMAEDGNPHQWGDEGYPKRELLENDIAAGNSYVLEEDGRVVGTFAFILGDDPTYSYIEDGAWLNSAPYGTIHRIAGDGVTRGVVRAAVDYARGVIPNLRIDTHFDNRRMQHVIEKNGFRRCGVIYVEDGSPRIAYQLPADEGDRA